MNLSFPFFQKDNREDIYLGLFIKEAEVIGFILIDKKGVIETVLEEKRILVNGWENIIEEIDDLVFSLENTSKTKVSQTIFFIYSHFIDLHTNELKKNYLEKIKELVKNLEIKPLGYIECYEAVYSYLSEKEQMPLSAIVVELDKNFISVFIYKAGHKILHRSLSRTDSITNDLEESFNQLQENPLLPSRIIVYDSSDVDLQSSKILSHKWQKDLFIQYPKVEILKTQEVHKGLIKIFSEQLVETSSKAIQESPKKEEKEVFGFVIGEDVKQSESRTDIKKKETIPASSILTVKLKFLNFIYLITEKIKKIKIKPNPRSTWFVGAIIILLTLVLSEFYLHKAKLTVFLPSDKLEDKITISTNMDGSSGEAEIKIATISGQFTDKNVTSGKRDVGDKAKGEVTVHNFDSKSKTFSKGIQIDYSSIKFLLDSDVTVASAAETTINGDIVKQPGKAKVKVTAVDIGEDSNLDKNKRFSISGESTSTYFALNEASFTGGNKKQINTVSKADIDNLKEKLLREAKKELDEKFLTGLTKDEQAVDKLTDYNYEKLNFSKELGEESDNIQLDAKISASYYVINIGKLKQTIADKLKMEVKDGYILENDRITYNITDTKLEGNKVRVDLKAESKAIKSIDNRNVLSKITLKSRDSLNKILKNEYGATGYELNVETPIFFYKNITPFFKDNIDLKISSL